MRYSIMLQLVTGIAFILVGSAAMFAWLQYRPGSEQGSNSDNTNYQLNRSHAQVRMSS